MPDSEWNSSRIRETVREHLLKEYLEGEDPCALKDTTPLITGGILDSITTAKFVMYLEEAFDIIIASNEVTLMVLDTLNDIVQLVERKLDCQ